PAASCCSCSVHRKATDALEPMPGDELGVQLAPGVEVRHRDGQFLDRQPAERLASVPAVVQTGRLRQRNFQVDDMVVLVTHQSVAESACNNIRIARSERVSRQHNADQPITQTGQVHPQLRPAGAAEQRIRPDRVMMGCPLDDPLEQPTARAWKLHWTPEFTERGRIAGVKVAGDLHGPGSYQFPPVHTRGNVLVPGRNGSSVSESRPGPGPARSAKRSAALTRIRRWEDVRQVAWRRPEPASVDPGSFCFGIDGRPGQEAFHSPPRSQDLTENRMRLEPVALLTEALALLPHPAFALLGSAHLLASPRQLIPRNGQRGLGPRELISGLGKLLLLGPRELISGLGKLLLGLGKLLLGLALPLRFKTLRQGLALSSVPRQQPSVALCLTMGRPLAAQFLVKHLCFMNDGRGLMMNTRSIENSQGVFFVPAQPTEPRSFRKVVEEALAAEPDGSRGLILALQDGLHPAEMNRDQIQRGPITQRTIAASAQTHSDLVRRAEQGDDDDPKRMELPQDLPPERPGEHGPWVFEPRDPARSDQPGNEPPALVEKFIRDLDALRPDPFSIKKPGQDFL